MDVDFQLSAHAKTRLFARDASARLERLKKKRSFEMNIWGVPSSLHMMSAMTL
jgi:hypothetical protein